MADSCSHNCSSCGVSGCGSRSEGPVKLSPAQGQSIKHVIGVVSGKGGVGKSLTTSLLASTLAKRGYKVGIMDADITGPSIPKAFGIKSRLMGDPEGRLVPARAQNGVLVLSSNMMLPHEDDPVAWRGPVITSILDQFFSETAWGDLDYLLIDMPPGTSDVLITVLQKLPVEALVTVSAPQELVGMIVGKAVKLAAMMDTRVVGLIENMAYFTCDECDKKHYIFGEPQGKDLAARYAIPATAELPLDPNFAKCCDEGRIFDYDVKDALDTIIDALNSASVEE